MNKFIRFYTVAFIILLSQTFTFAQNTGDTINVQTFTFGSPQDAWFVFPSDTISVEKILMKYTLKCNPAQSPACGEWDYLTYTYLYDHTGLTDSAANTQNLFTINGQSIPQFTYTFQPQYQHFNYWQYFNSYTDTSNIHIGTIGNQSFQNHSALHSSNAVSRSQHLWTAAELSAAGLTAGPITGLKLNIINAGNLLRHLTLKIASTTNNDLDVNSLINTGFITTYSANKQLINGLNDFIFTAPFFWDGTSNLVLDMSFENLNNGTDQIIEASEANGVKSIYSKQNDLCISANPTGTVNIPINNSIASLDTFVTVSLWAYGDPNNQPSNGTGFEALDGQGNRVLNTHIPWSDSQVYWDAGFSGTTYDRINKSATSSEIKGQWNFWTFTKNAATGSMKIYLNGNLWHSGTGKTKIISNIQQFKLASMVNTNNTYAGKIDNFAVFNKELNQSEIQSIMYQPIDTNNSLYNHLAVYYLFNNGGSFAQDYAPGNHSPGFLQNVNTFPKNPAELNFYFMADSLRPNVSFVQGVFTVQSDSILVNDSVYVAPVQILTYQNNGTPTTPVDTIWAWPLHYYNYVYDANGNAIDSTMSLAVDTLFNGTFTYYNYFPQVIRYELARYITPYGNGLSLGNGWTWTFDVSDYRTLLHDSVHLAAGNWQELLDMKFEFIIGTPPRDIISIQNIYSGSYDYGNANNPIENHLQPVKIKIPSNAVTARWKSRITGHGMDTPENCAEFCPKTHYFKVNGVQQFSQLVWRDNCDVNPLYPQGGTWVYDRSNWCPGAEVWTYNFELTPFITPGDSITLDHDAQPYTNTGGWDYYQIEDQIVTYGSPNFTNDAALEVIYSPSNDQMYQRFNTICTNPKIRIKNNGSNNLTSLTITYGIVGATPSVYQWTGNLKFEETQDVTLGNFNWMQGADKFMVSISSPNGVADEYIYNNTITSKYNYPPVMPKDFIVTCKTNLQPWENEYSLKDAAGNIIFERNNLAANTIYRDTVHLSDGCYEIRLTDSGEDGLSFWANSSQGTGYFRFNNINGGMLKSFGADFGGEIYLQFTVGLTNNLDEYVFEKNQVLHAFPNPSNGKLYVTMDFPENSSGVLNIVDMLGKNVYQYEIKSKTADFIEVDMSNLQSGVYQVILNSNSGTSYKKVVLQK